MNRTRMHVAGWLFVMATVVVGPVFSQDQSEELSESFRTAKETAQVNRDQANFHRLLGKCPAKAQREFLENFVLVNGKLGGTRVKEIKECLAAGEFKELLAFFAAPAPLDHEKYQCSSRGTCTKNDDAICTSNCRSDGDGGIFGNKDGYVYLPDVLKDCSQAQRDEFSSSLRFEHGRLASASYDRIASCSGQAGEVFRKYQAPANEVAALCGGLSGHYCETPRGTCRPCP